MAPRIQAIGLDESPEPLSTISATGPKNASATTSIARPESSGSTMSLRSSRSTPHDPLASSIEFCSASAHWSSSGLTFVGQGYSRERVDLDARRSLRTLARCRSCGLPAGST